MKKCCLVMSLLTVLLAAGNEAEAFEARFETASEQILSNPHDIELSADGALLYVSDLGNNRIAVLDGRTLKFLGSFGEADGLGQPHDVDLGSDGRLYVADTVNDRIVVYAPAGQGASKSGEITGGVRAPEGVLALANGDVVATGARSGNIVLFKDGKPVKDAGGLRSPHDIAAAAEGNLWVADAGNDRMLLMSSDFKILKELKGDAYAFSGPRYLDLTEDGLLIVADKNTHSVKVIAPDGKMLAVLGTGKPGMGPGLFTTPEGVVTRSGDLWIADSGNNRVVRYRIMQ